MIYTLRDKQLLIIFKPNDILINYYLTIGQSILMAALQWLYIIYGYLFQDLLVEINTQSSFMLMRDCPVGLPSH